MYDFERNMEARDRRRGLNETRIINRLEKLEKAAEPLVGELCREGETIHYINVRSKAGVLTGKTREFPTNYAAVNFLIRNNYV